MIVSINGRKVTVADHRARKVMARLEGRTRKDRIISRQIKEAGILPRSIPGNSLAFQTGSNYYDDSQTDAPIVVRTSLRDRPESHLSHSVKFSK